jgi:3-deoxy-D-manno-octulosonic-acid transferase
MHLIYTALLLTGLLLSGPYYLLRSRRYLSTIRERLGHLPGKPLRRSIWVHAVSVGEVRAVETLLERLRASYPDRPLALSTTTPTGQELARTRAGIDRVFYFPFDLPWAVRRTLDHVDPEVLIIAETEIWPNLIRECHRRGVKLMMINGRIADRSLARYQWIRRWLEKLLSYYSVLGVQSQLDGERMEAIGGQPARINVFGNIKYDAPARAVSLDGGFTARLQASQPLWVAASTAPGEEDLILDAYATLRENQPGISLLIAPRKPERFEDVATLIRNRGYRCVRRSSVETNHSGNGVILLDTIGELASVFQHAAVVFMGGTLVPFGGHNILEPARFAKPIVFGPHMENFREMSALFLKGQGAIQIVEARELAKTVSGILGDQPMAAALGVNARRIADEHAGATDRFLTFLRATLSSRSEAVKL